MSNTQILRPTSKQVENFVEYMLRFYGLKTKDKKSSSLMKFFGWFLNLISLMTKKEFMEYTTVVRETIYIPFIIGDDKTMPLENQISTFTHECEHDLQREDEFLFMFDIKYVCSSSYRAKQETEAYITNMEIHFWHTGEILSARYLSNRLYKYGCKTEDILIAEGEFEKAGKYIKQGHVKTHTGKTAIMWLSKNMPEYKNKGTKLSKEHY